jgi:hypothetical protein
MALSENWFGLAVENRRSLRWLNSGRIQNAETVDAMGENRDDPYSKHTASAWLAV